MNRCYWTALLLGLWGLSGPVRPATAQLWETLADSVRADLRAALDELAQARQQIEAQRLPLAQKLAGLEHSVLQERAMLQRAQRQEANQLVLLGVLRSEVQGLSNEVRSLESILGEYRRTIESRLPIAEVVRYEDALRASAAAAEAPDLSPADRLTRQLQFVSTTLQRLEAAIGGDRFPGQALTPAGVMSQGTFLQFGPAAYFSAVDSAVSGVVEQRLNSPAPNVAEIPLPEAKHLQQIIAAGAGELPVDVTSGDALRLQTTRDPLRVHIAKGGPVMVPILGLGVVTLLIFAVKWFQVRKVTLATAADLRAILAAIESGQSDKATRHACKLAGPVGEMLVMAIQHHREPKEYIEEVMYEKMLETRPRLERLVPFLALAAAAAPLLGLLGTVTGMINTFNMITVFGTGDPKTLAGGISEALITTEFGLIVAIPALLLHAILSRKVKAVLAGMEQTATAFINGLPDVPIANAAALNSTPSHV